MAVTLFTPFGLSDVWISGSRTQHYGLPPAEYQQVRPPRKAEKVLLGLQRTYADAAASCLCRA